MSFIIKFLTIVGLLFFTSCEDEAVDTPPGVSNVTSVDYTVTEMTVQWEQSTDEDFQDYKVFYATSEDGEQELIATYTDISTTSHSISEFNATIENWFFVQVTNTAGLTTMGTGMTNAIDSPPTAPVLDPIVFEDGYFMIEWSMNYDDDFKSYTLYESESVDMVNQIEIYSTENRTNSYHQLNVVNWKRYYYQVVVSDSLGLQSLSNVEMGDGRPDGLVLEDENGNELHRQFEGVIYGGIVLAPGETLEISVHFLDGQEEKLDTNNPIELELFGVDAFIAVVTVEEGITFNVEGVSVGSTSFTLNLLYDGDSSFSSFPIPITVDS